MKRVFAKKTSTGKSQKELFQSLHKLKQQRSNKVCCDCDAPDPEWAVIFNSQSASSSSPSIRSGSSQSKPFGVFVCYSCSVAHKILEAPGTIVKSLSVGSWTHDEVLAMERGGNHLVNALFEADLVIKNGRKPCESSEMLRRQAYCHLKYTRRYYYHEDVSKTTETETSDEDQLLDFVTARSERSSRTLSAPSIPENWDQNMISEHDDDPWWEPSKDFSEVTATTAADSVLGSNHSRVDHESSSDFVQDWSSHSKPNSSGPSSHSASWSSHSRLDHCSPSSPNLSSHSRASITTSTPPIIRAARRMSTDGSPSNGNRNLSSHSRTSVTPVTQRARATRRMSTGGSPSNWNPNISSHSRASVTPSTSRTRATRRMSTGACNELPNQPRQRSQSRRSSIGGQQEQSINPRLSLMTTLETELNLQSPRIHRTKSKRRFRTLSLPDPDSLSGAILVHSSPDSEMSGTVISRPKLITRHQSLSANCRATVPQETGRRNSLSDFLLQMKESKGGESSRSNHRLKYTDDDDIVSVFAVDPPKHEQQEMDRKMQRSASGTFVVSPSFKQRRKGQQRRSSISQSHRTGLIANSNREAGTSEASTSTRRRQSLQFLRESLGSMTAEAPKW